MVIRAIILFFSIWLLNSCTTRSQTREVPFRDTQNHIIKKNIAAEKDSVTEIYCRAISEYLKASFEKHRFSPDTLFIGIMPEEPVINWPEVIENIPIRGITIEASKEKMTQTKTWSNVNIVGWPVKKHIKFLVITFLDGGKPQHNCHLYFVKRPELKKLELDSLNFEYAYVESRKNYEKSR
jgi:hypothetical protein